ncbi:glycogen/starch synthase [Streptomyces sp. SP18CS02]|uniref:glycogen/starch synthase n=1 Tax=Streptomyces sp. SP18CS02 TaxID=3002531 RepID=UPI002E75B0D3|nr:glycogen/starch synthase [Streptomyces sp. SP18CS02]MEE1752149.1 glycogen/starch synthase [Streptomyces sp. SP18CS02]
MHIIETYFECGGFDHRFLQGGISVYLWNLSKALADQGHRVSVVTPAHGRLDDLRGDYDLETLDYHDTYELPLVLDPGTWGERFPAEVRIPLTTTAHRLRLDGVDLYFLSNQLLDELPDRFYPPYGSKGHDLVFFKPLAYQVDTIRFVRHRFADDKAVIHAHEPYYHYLMPAAFRNDPRKTVVGTVQSNMPITKKVYRPKVERLLTFLDAGVTLPAEDADHPLTEHEAVMSGYQQLTHLHYEYGPGHVRVYDLVADHADLVDFLSPGHQDFYTAFADTPFEQLFTRLPVHDTVRRNAHKNFVGGCAVGDTWTAGGPPSADRASVLGGLGLDHRLPTFFHNARYAVNHKGQTELFRAVDRVLDEGLAANFVLRCISDDGIDDPYAHEVAERHKGRVHLEWRRVEEQRIVAYAASSDFCLFPSKFEMDTFLIAQGEAMAVGAVPIATAQLGMAHFGHTADPLDGPDAAGATGFAVNRSFAEDDPLLVDALARRIHQAAALLNEQPEQYRRLRANAMANARRFTWDRAARLHLDAFTPLWEGRRPQPDVATMLRHGWFDLLPPEAYDTHREEIAEAAARLGDADAYRRCRELDGPAARALFEAAWERADFARCERTADSDPALRARLRGRCTVRGGRIVYRLPHAERVELVEPAPDGPGRQPVTVRRLTRDGTEFTGAPPATGRELHLLITLSTGRTVWDVVRHG